MSYGHFIANVEFWSQCRSEAENSCFFQIGLKPMPGSHVCGKQIGEITNFSKMQKLVEMQKVRSEAENSCFFQNRPKPCSKDAP